MKLNRKALLTLLTTAILLTPSSEKGNNTNNDVTFKICNSDQMVEDVMNDQMFYFQNELLEQLLNRISNFSGIYYLKNKTGNDQESNYIYQQLTLREKRYLKFTFSDESGIDKYIIEDISLSSEENNYYKKVESKQLFEDSIDDISEVTMRIEDKNGNSLTHTLTNYFFADRESYRIEFNDEYTHNFLEIKKSNIAKSVLEFELQSSFINYRKINEAEYEALKRFFEENKHEKNYAIMLNAIYDFLKTLDSNKVKTI